MIHPTDILLRNGTTWISQRLIMEACGVDEVYLRARIRPMYKKSLSSSDRSRAGDFLPDNGKAWRWGRTDGRFYYDYNNIPDRKPAYYRSRLGTLTDLHKQWEQSKQQQDHNHAAGLQHQLCAAVDAADSHDLVTYYIYQAPVNFSPEKAAELCRAKTWLDCLSAWSSGRQFTRFGFHSIKQLYHTAAVAIASENLEGLRISTPGALRNKVDEYPAGDPEAERLFMISAKYQNANALQVGKVSIVDEYTGEIFPYDYHQAVMHNGFMNPGNSAKNPMRFSYENNYLPEMENLGIRPIAYRTYTYHLSKYLNRLISAKERHGADYFRKMMLTYVPGKKLKYSHSLIAGDGSGTIAYKYVDNSGKWNTMKLFVMLLGDVASRKITGWAAAPAGQHAETHHMLRKALEMTVQNTGKRTLFEYISDNHSAFTGKKSSNMLNLVFDKVRTITPGNSQANPAETAFRLFKGSLKHFENFVSSSWDAGIEGQSNPDYLDIESLPTYHEALDQFAQCVEDWNTRPLPDGTTVNQRYAGNVNPAAKPMDERVIRFLFGESTKVDASLGRGFIEVSKTHGYYKRETFLFEIPPHAIESITNADGKYGAEVKVCWDQETADVYTTTNKYIISCDRADGSAISHAESGDNSDAILGHHLQRKETIEAMADKHVNEVMEAFAATKANMPYQHHMATGGSKETWNQAMTEEEQIKKLKKERIARNFKQITPEN